MCLVEKLHQKAEDPGGFDLDAFPDILKSLISRWVKTLHRLLSPRSTVLVGNEDFFSVRPAQVSDCSQSCTQTAQHGLSCLFLMIASSPPCVLVRKGVCSLPTVLECLLDAQIVRPQFFTVVRAEAMWWLHHFVLFKMVMDVSQSRLRQGVFAEGLPRCWRAVAVLDWVGRKEWYQVLFSVLDFFVQPNLELQQP